MTTPVRPLTVGDRMTLEPILIRAEAPLSEAADLMHRRRVHGLPVVDAGGLLVGVISQTDLSRARSTEYLWANWPGLRVRHLMTSPPVTVERSTLLTTAARKMERHRIHRLVVVDDGDASIPIGVLSMTDLIDAIADEIGSEPSALGDRDG